MFLTNIPEYLFTELQTNLHAARDELTDTRRQNSELNQRNADLKGQEDVLTKEIRKKIDELAALQSSKASLEAEMTYLAGERDIYLKEARRVVIAKFFSALDTRIKTAEEHNAKARTLPQIEKWLTDYQKDPNSSDEDKAWITSLPPDWRIAVINIGMNGSIHNMFRYDNPEIPPIFNDYHKRVKEFSDSLSNPRMSPLPFSALVDEELKSDYFSALLPSDRTRLLNEIKTFVREHPEHFTRPLEIFMPRSWTDNVLNETNRAKLALVARVKEDLASLKQRLNF